jgi:hypothetical protein
MLAATAGHTDRAAASFRAAVDAGDAVGAPLLAAESRLEWARLSVLDRSCPGPPPIDLVDAAISAADSCGATALVERALDLRSAL